MTTVFEGAPKFGGISGDHARVTAIEDRVLIRAIDSMAEEAVTIAMTPDQARALAAGIVAAAETDGAMAVLFDGGDIIGSILGEAISAIPPADVLAKVGVGDALADAAKTLIDALDGSDRDKMHRVVLAAFFGAARYDQMTAAPSCVIGAPMAMLRALLTAIIDPADPALDDLRACNQQPAPDPVARLVEADTPRAWTDVLDERKRQITVEGWTPEHDDAHEMAEMAQAAACYALSGTPADEAVFIHGRWRDARDLFWPRQFGREWWKPTNRRRDLVKAGALILAEIERLDRAALAAMETSHD